MLGPQPFFIRFSVSFVPVCAQLLQPPPTPGDPIFCIHEVFYNRIILKAHWNSNRCYKMNRLICPDQTLDVNLQAELVLLGWRVTLGEIGKWRMLRAHLLPSTLRKEMMLAAVYPQRHFSRLKLHPHTVKCQWWHLLVCLFMVYIERNSAGWNPCQFSWDEAVNRPHDSDICLPYLHIYSEHGLGAWQMDLSLRFLLLWRIDKSLEIYLFGGWEGAIVFV